MKKSSIYLYYRYTIQYGAASVQLLHTQTFTNIHSRALTTLTYSHTHRMHVACHCPNVSSRGLPIPHGTSLRLHAVSSRLSRLRAHPSVLVTSSAFRVLPILVRPTVCLPGRVQYPCAPFLHSCTIQCTLIALQYPPGTPARFQLSCHTCDLRLAPRPLYLSLPSTATFHLLVPPNVLTTTTLLCLAGFFQSFTSHLPARS